MTRTNLILALCLGCSDKNTDASTDDTADGASSCADTTGLAELSTDSDILALADATNAFLDSLDADQRLTVQYCLDDAELYSWTNIDVGDMPRTGGVSFGDLSDDQITALYAVFSAFLSTQGYEDVYDIINVIEPATAEKYADNPERTHGVAYYTAVVFGTPGVDGSWGVQLDGHHLAITFLVHGDRATIVPAFSGADPSTVDGVNVFADEEAPAYAFVASLTADQLATATISDEIFRDIFTSNNGFSNTDDGRDYDVSAFEGVGLAASELSADQDTLLRAIVTQFVNDQAEPFATSWWSEIDAYWDQTRFSWVGETADGSAMYFRVYSPALVIEYIHSNGETSHPHVMLRVPNTGAYDETSDYGVFAAIAGQDPLRDHLRYAAHHAADRERLRARPAQALLALARVHAASAWR